MGALFLNSKPARPGYSIIGAYNIRVAAMRMQKTGDPKTDALIDKHQPELRRMESEALQVAESLEEGIKRTVADYRRLREMREPEDA